MIDILHAKNLPRTGLTSSDPYVLIRFGGNEVARTAVVKWSQNPIWGDSFTVPLLHILRPLVLELWHWKRLDRDELIGKVTINLKDICSNNLEEHDSEIECVRGKSFTGHLTYAIFLEKRKSLINVSPLSTDIGTVNATPSAQSINTMIKDMYNSLKILPSAQEALEKSEFIKQADFSFPLFRDILFDMQRLATFGKFGDDNKLQSPPLSVPMSLHRIDEPQGQYPLRLKIYSN